MFGPPLLQQMSADVVRRLQTFSCKKTNSTFVYVLIVVMSSVDFFGDKAQRSMVVHVEDMEIGGDSALIPS
ncbi:hypothetical protein QVD17_25041 [Tagetes erecta]|uniref:Uncharacterized protein n=1 Tax=Tagetes erecta TaxID=13708 RepID=A0AAD8KIQ5_TARER|nr:hypothetical protein QVD17_25041 [Tagetes erecta]